VREKIGTMRRVMISNSAWFSTGFYQNSRTLH